jgi:hypothetical protein
MSIIKPYQGSKNQDFTERSKSEFPEMSGIYIGIIKQYDTNTRSGRFWVYIPQEGGADPDDQTNWRLVNYASPYMGSTQGSGSEYAQTYEGSNTFSKSIQSYGFYMTPPDVGSQVLCCFISGNLEGYWFACVNNSVTKHMIPAIGCVSIDQIDPLSIEESNLQGLLDRSLSYPVAEANDNFAGTYKEKYIPSVLKPLHVPQTINLIKTGLISDQVRGAISSSSQRDPISTVFGFSTPGRPWLNQDPANDPSLRSKLLSGDFNPADFKVTTRVGGHTLVLDDGDIYGKNNLVRLRTAGGNQILMSDSENLIYVSNSNGTAWIELSAEGDVLVYGARDFAVRTQGNIEMHSDRSINFNAGGNFSINAEASVKIQAQVIQARADTLLNLYGKQTQIKGQSATSIQSGGSMQLKSSGAMLLNGSKIALNGEGGGGSVNAPQKIKEFNLPDAVINDNRWEAYPDKIQSICRVVPTHEPYIRGNIAAAAQNQVDIQSALTTDINGQPISPPVNIKDVGTKQAESFTINDPAPVGEFIAQPTPVAGIGSLSNAEVQGLFAQYGYNSSNNNYDTVNDQGLVGKYGLSSQDLINQGYLIEGTPQTKEALENPNNWIGKNGINGLDNFLSSPAVQERTMYDTTRDTYAKLEGLGLITTTTTAEDAAGLVGAAKYSSPETVYQWVTKGNAVDPKIIDAYNSSKYSVTQAPIIEQSNKSKLGL